MSTTRKHHAAIDHATEFLKRRGLPCPRVVPNAGEDTWTLYAILDGEQRAAIWFCGPKQRCASIRKRGCDEAIWMLPHGNRGLREFVRRVKETP